MRNSATPNLKKPNDKMIAETHKGDKARIDLLCENLSKARKYYKDEFNKNQRLTKKLENREKQIKILEKEIQNLRKEFCYY